MPPLTENGLTITKEKIWSANTGRTAAGYMVGDLVSVKYKLQCNFMPLSREDVKKIDSAISTPYFHVKFTDPSTDEQIEIEAYAGTPTYPVFQYKDGVPTYVGVYIDLIER